MLIIPARGNFYAWRQGLFTTPVTIKPDRIVGRAHSHPTPFGGRLASFFPTSGYPSLDLYRYVYLVRAVQNCLHPFDHRLLQPSLCVCGLLCVALDNHLVVTDKDWHSTWALAPTLPQKRQCQLQAVCSGSLDGSVEAVGQPLDVHAAPAGRRPGFVISALPDSPFVIVPPF